MLIFTKYNYEERHSLQNKKIDVNHASFHSVLWSMIAYLQNSDLLLWSKLEGHEDAKTKSHGC